VIAKPAASTMSDSVVTFKKICTLLISYRSESSKFCKVRKSSMRYRSPSLQSGSTFAFVTSNFKRFCAINSLIAVIQQGVRYGIGIDGASSKWYHDPDSSCRWRSSMSIMLPTEVQANTLFIKSIIFRTPSSMLKSRRVRPHSSFGPNATDLGKC